MPKRLLSGLMGRIRGWRRPQASPVELLKQAPRPIAEMLRAHVVTGLPPSPPPKQHWIYQVGDDLLLHVYGHAEGRVRRSIPDREALQREVRVPGLPLLRLTAESDQLLWLVEDRLKGAEPRGTDVERWFPAASAWLVRLAGPVGPPLQGTLFWENHHHESIEVTPPALRHAVSRAWAVIGSLPGRTLHGDVQPRNLVFGSHGVGLVDWGGCWRHGLPGLDLVFLALMSGPAVPDAAVLEALAQDEDPPGKPLRGALAAAGLPSETLYEGLLAMLATWSLGEARRISRTGGRGNPTPFRNLLSRVGPALHRG